MKNSTDTSWDGTSDLPICIAQHLNHCATAVPGEYCELVILPENGRWDLTRVESVKRVKPHFFKVNPLSAKLNPICHLLALLETHHFFSR